MADTATAPEPKWQLLLGLLPSLNTALVAIVTAAISIAGTWWAVKPERAPPPQAAPIVVASKPDPRLDDIADKLGQIAKMLEPKAPRAAKKEIAK